MFAVTDRGLQACALLFTYSCAQLLIHTHLICYSSAMLLFAESDEYRKA